MCSILSQRARVEVHLEASQGLKEGLRQGRQLVAEAVHLDVDPCQALCYHVVVQARHVRQVCSLTQRILHSRRVLDSMVAAIISLPRAQLNHTETEFVLSRGNESNKLY